MSLAPTVLFSTEREVMDGMYKLKDAVLDPDCLVSGESFFDRLSENPEMSSLFNELMANSSRMFLREVSEVYEGFEGLEELMDVGGGVGTSLEKIVSKYPRIHMGSISTCLMLLPRLLIILVLIMLPETCSVSYRKQRQ